MIKSVQNDQKNSLKDQNLKKQRNRRIFFKVVTWRKKSRLRAFARTRAKNSTKDIHIIHVRVSTDRLENCRKKKNSKKFKTKHPNELILYSLVITMPFETLYF